MPDAPLFPALDGSSPGEAPRTQDITGTVLPASNEPNGRPALGGSSLSMVPEHLQSRPAADAPAIPEVEVGVDGGPPGARRGRSAQDRIATLTKNWRQEQEGNAQLNNQLAQVLSLVQNQAAELSNLKSNRASAPANSGSSPFGAGSEAANSNAPISLDAIHGVVREAIGSYDRELRQAQVGQLKLQQAHENSFSDAVVEFPELGDQRTSARQTFNKLFANSPLRALPDAPYQIALQVRGILADEARTASAKADQKRLASPMAPSPSGNDVPGYEAAADSKRLAQLGLEIKKGNSDYAVFREWKALRDKVRPSFQIIK